MNYQPAGENRLNDYKPLSFPSALLRYCMAWGVQVVAYVIVHGFQYDCLAHQNASRTFCPTLGAAKNNAKSH